jgi:hypothetical protein
MNHINKRSIGRVNPVCVTDFSKEWQGWIGS